MWDYILLITGVAVAFHAYTYGRWLKKQGNRLGAATIFLLVMAAVTIPLWRVIMSMKE